MSLKVHPAQVEAIKDIYRCFNVRNILSSLLLYCPKGPQTSNPVPRYNRRALSNLPPVPVSRLKEWYFLSLASAMIVFRIYMLLLASGLTHYITQPIITMQD
jgi:hypothetical protein